MRAGRIVAIVVGTILALGGALVTIAATLGLVLAGGDNTIETGTQRLSTPTSAITSGSAKIEGERPVGWFFDEGDDLALRITSEAPGGTTLFLGIGPTDDVRTYLDGVVYDEIDDISFRPFGVDYDRRGPVDGRDPAPPADQTFWTVRSEGTAGTVQVDWDYAPGSYTVVLMNADGSPNVVADTSLELEVPFLRTALIGATLIGALVLLLGLVVAFFVGRGRRRRSDSEPPAPPPASSAPPPDTTPPPAAPTPPAEPVA